MVAGAGRHAFPIAVATGRLAELFCSHQGEGPHVGRLHLFVRLAGCRVGCRYCDTPDALRAGQEYEVRAPGGATEVRANPVDGAALAREVERLASSCPPLHAVAVTGGEPLEQVDFLSDFLPRVRLPVLLETAGVHPAELERVVEHVAIVSMDLKLPSVARTAPAFDEHQRFLAIARRAPEVYVKVVVSPRLDPAEWRAACSLAAATWPDVPFFVQPETDRQGHLTVDHPFLFDLAATAARLGLSDVRVLPQVHKFLAAP